MMAFSAENTNGFILLERMRHGSLEACLASEKEITSMQRSKWCSQATKGVALLHELGVIHSNIKPQNILLKDNMCIES